MTARIDRSASFRNPLARVVNAVRKDPIAAAGKALVAAALLPAAAARPAFAPTTTSVTLDARSDQAVLALPRASATVHTHHGDVVVFAQPGQSLADRLAELAHNDVGNSTQALENGPPSPDQLDAARKVLLAAPKDATIRDYSSAELSALSVMLHNTGQKNVKRHLAWHNYGGKERAGGEEGHGSGDLFLGFHRQMVSDVEHDVGPAYRIPQWRPTWPVPPELTAQTGTPRSRDPMVPVRGYFTLEGRPDEAWYDVDSNEYTKLGDFKTPDMLGEGIGSSGYHASVHFAVGGIMTSFESPLDDAFYLWHGHIDDLFTTWLEATEAGRSFTATNPSEPLLRRDTKWEVYDSILTLAAARRDAAGVGIESHP